MRFKKSSDSRPKPQQVPEAAEPLPIPPAQPTATQQTEEFGGGLHFASGFVCK